MLFDFISNAAQDWTLLMLSSPPGVSPFQLTGKDGNKEKRCEMMGGWTRVAAVGLERSALVWRPPLIGSMGCDSEENTDHFL